MKDNLIVSAIAVIGTVSACLALAWWQNVDVSSMVVKRLALPGEISQASTVSTTAVEIIAIGEKFKKGDGLPSQISGAWANFRGPNHDNISPEDLKLADTWPAEGPPALWSVDLGEGYAGPAVRDGRVYLLDYDNRGEADVLRCLSLDGGKEIWRRWYKVRVKRNHGMSRTVPAVTARHVVTIGPRCHVMCVDAANGDLKWGIDLEKDWGTQVPMWYTGQCPFIDGDQLVLGVGGKALMMGVDCETGTILWQTPNPKGWQMSHSSVVTMKINGRRMYVYPAIGGIVGVSAEDKDRGTLLWDIPEWNHSVVSPSPVPFDDGRIFVTAGYGVGSAMFKVSEESGKYGIKRLYVLDKKVFACEQHTPIFYRNHLYSILPADAGPSRKEMVCMDPDGKVAWSSGQSDRYGLGPYLVADNKIFILSDDGVLTLIKATHEKFVRLAQAKVLDGKEAWAPMALVNGRLLARDYGRMVCLDVRAK